MLIIGTDIFSHHIYFYSLASLFSRVKAIHKTPNKLIRLSTNLTLFETGIKVVDLLTPYVQGGKIDLFGGAGLGNIAIEYGAFLYLQVLVKELVKEMIYIMKCRIQVLYLVQIYHHSIERIFLHKSTQSTPMNEMNKHTWCKNEVSHVSLTMAEYFRDALHSRCTYLY